MSLQPNNSSSSNESRELITHGSQAVDSGFELLGEPDTTQSHEHDEGVYWYAASDSPEPIGPISSIEMRERIASGSINLEDFVWREGMSQWTRMAEHFDTQQSEDTDSQTPKPPPLPESSSSLNPLKFLDFLGNWNPSVFAFRILARSFLAFGILTVILSLLLLPFGISWFSGGLQVLLIASVLELAAVVRETLLSNKATPTHLSDTNEANTL
ncbi:MAG: hypothetical protein COA78_16355 [Blastopirellula sp.]|nr:MAG: hypothetical protein COA78_16355 [Blastopirellula sp.]